MQCVEFETRLSDLLDERALPSFDLGLVEHAQSCARCSELLGAHEALLEGVAAMPAARLDEVERLAMAHRIVAEVGSAPVASFPVDNSHNDDRASFPRFAGEQSVPSAAPLELAPRRETVVAQNRTAPLALMGFVLATAAALLIALLPWFRGEEQPVVPDGQRHHIVDVPDQQPPSPDDTTEVLRNYNDLALIARVGYQVADGLTPVTNSMVSALRELRKRPLFRGPEDVPGRSSSYLPREADDLFA
jgi:hypothetical protein